MLKSPVSSFKTHPSESVVPEVGDLAEYRRGLVARHYATQGRVAAVHIQQHSRMVHSRSEGRFRHRRVLASRKKPAARWCWRKCTVLVSGVVGVAARVVAIEGATIVRIERQAEFDPFRQVGIRDEVATESDQAGIANGDARLSGVGIESASRNDRSPEDLVQLLGCDGRLRFRDSLTALHSRFNQMQVRESETVEALCDVAK